MGFLIPGSGVRIPPGASYLKFKNDTNKNLRQPLREYTRAGVPSSNFSVLEAMTTGNPKILFCDLLFLL